MPYIITTTTERATARSANGRELERHERSGTLDVTRHAVATLDEARETVHDFIGEHYAGHALDAEWSTFHNHADCVVDGTSRLPIGPLPDGTVVEVQRVSWREIYERAFATRAVRYHFAHNAGYPRMISAYNARHGA